MVSRPRNYLRLGYLGLTAVISLAIAFTMSQRPPAMVTVPVAQRDLPPYHVITSADLSLKSLEAAKFPSDGIRENKDIVGRYSLEMITADAIVREGQLHAVSNSGHITGTDSIGIPATPSMVLGGNLKAGDIVDLILVPAAAESQRSSGWALFESIRVIDVVPTSGGQVTPGLATEPAYVVVVALPADRRLEFAARSVGATMLITRRQ